MSLWLVVSNVIQWKWKYFCWQEQNWKSSHLWTLDKVRDPSLTLCDKMDVELSAPEGWMVEKDEQGTESFLSPDGTSLASRRLDNQILRLLQNFYFSSGDCFAQHNTTHYVSTKQISEFNKGPHFKVEIHIQLVPICIDTRPKWLPNYRNRLYYYAARQSFHILLIRSA